MLMKKAVEKVRSIKLEAIILYRACRDPRIHWLPRVLILVSIAYALSPIDLIPDFIPVLGYLDDIIILPLLIMAARKMIPADIYEEYRREAASAQPTPCSYFAAAMVIITWCAVIYLAIRIITGLTCSPG